MRSSNAIVKIKELESFATQHMEEFDQEHLEAVRMCVNILQQCDHDIRKKTTKNMLKCDFSDYCDGCPYLNVDATVDTYWAGSVCHVVGERVFCSNEEICKRIADIYEKRKGE